MVGVVIMYRWNLLEEQCWSILFCWYVLGRRLAELEMYSMLAHVRKEKTFI